MYTQLFKIQKGQREQPTHTDWQYRRKYINNATFGDSLSKETFGWNLQSLSSCKILQNSSDNWSKTTTQTSAELLFSAHFLILTLLYWIPLPLLSGAPKSERENFFHNRFYKSCLLLVFSEPEGKYLVQKYWKEFICSPVLQYLNRIYWQSSGLGSQANYLGVQRSFKK